MLPHHRQYILERRYRSLDIAFDLMTIQQHGKQHRAVKTSSKFHVFTEKVVR